MRPASSGLRRRPPFFSVHGFRGTETLPRPSSNRREIALERLEALIALARGARGGGRPELEALLRGSAGLAHALARARLGDTLAAEEAAIESLARVARSLGGLRDPAAYPHWLARVVERCAADVARGAPGPEPLAAEPADPRDGPVAIAVAAERATRIREALAALPPGLRRPILLHFVEGHSYREVAVTLGVGLGTVARRVERALAAIRRELGGEP